MADVFAYLYGFGAGGDITKSVIIVTAPTGSTVTCTKGTTVKTATEKNGEWWFKNLDTGTWTVKATLSGQTATQAVNITQYGVYRIAIVYRKTPDFTYSGDYKVVQDNDAPISDFANWKGNWKIRFLTSGTFTVRNMYGWNGAIDVFLVGGGGSSTRAFRSYPGGAGSGYTKTAKKIQLALNTNYLINIGSGAAPGEGIVGGTTSAFSNTANGGHGTTSDNIGGNGGSSGGRGNNDGAPACNGASDGGSTGGVGQGTTTREFGEASGKLYAGGGAGYGGTAGSGGGGNLNSPGETNTGGGAGGYVVNGAASSSGSGIVIIRNAR